MAKSDWKETGWYIEAKGSRHLFSVIGSIGGYSSDAKIAWRGQASTEYDLVSSLQRSPGISSEEEMRKRELLLLKSARQWGLGFGPSGWASDLQLLADLQHYGTATRLLDVTSNPMTALWFACQDVQPKGSTINDGILLALNTAGWKSYGRSHPSGSYRAVESPLSWELEAALDSAQPFIVESLSPNDRLRAQEGFFVAGRIPERSARDPFKSFHVNYEPTTYEELSTRLNDQVGGSEQRRRLPFVAVIIPAWLKGRVLLRLANSYNRRPNVLFPDFTGFRDHGAYVEPRKTFEGSS
ncbi:MAG: FRG domain-containing protein [Herbiconiux sp.]|uniref:FRG domain-containing protein n=1 Tax=Herbiconiux sp. TaxID=1871186 RepID=UPI0012298E7D|nr:FRG domain-containing protein [Herbiconiux sp.]TAJ46885.1 MAG: FRG domain-containing protein [Herbiconiux sp.]